MTDCRAREGCYDAIIATSKKHSPSRSKKTKASPSRSKAQRSPLFTIGYEGRTLDEVLALLRANRVDRVIDVRELPLSRRRGFSKTPLGEALAGAGIDYVHLRIAGNPYRALRSDVERCLSLYRAHLEASPEVIAAVIDAAHGHRAALLCFEREPHVCHRSIIAAGIAPSTGTATVDL